MSKTNYVVNSYTCQHNGQETCKGCNTFLVGDNEPYENWQLREDLESKDQKIIDLEAKLAEKENEIQSLKLLLDSVDHYKQYQKDANLVILNPENCYADGYKVVIKTDNQTAIAVLEEMLDNEVYINSKLDFEDGNYVLSKIIRTKIEELKNDRN